MGFHRQLYPNVAENLRSKRYDDKLGHVFDLQDTITQKIVSALAVKLTTGEQEQTTRGDTENIEAYDAFL